MGRATHRARGRWMAVAAVAVVSLVVAAVVVRQTVLRDKARAVPVEVARDRYERAVTPPTTDPRPAGSSVVRTSGGGASVPDSTSPDTAEVPVDAPRPTLAGRGVYRYRTTGQETIDALGGTVHHYPAETAITVTPQGCGVLVRWDALVERRDEWRLCVTASGVELQPDGLQYHEFFGQATAEDVVCDRAVLVVPGPSVDGRPPVALSCTLGEDRWEPTWEVLERDVRVVGGERIDVVHVRMTVSDDDEHWERTVVDWYLTDGGLPVEVLADKESSSPAPIGDVRYEETYRLELISLQPLK